MPSISEIEASLGEYQITLAGNLVQDLSKSGRYFVFVEIERDDGGKQTPSSRYLNGIAESFAEKGIELAFILAELGSDDIQGSVKTMLFRSFQATVRNAFLTYEGNNAVIWIEPKKILDATEEESINQKLSEFFELLKIPLHSVNFTNSDDVSVATPTAILRTIKIKSPVTMNLLSTALKEKGFSVPSDQWLNRILDRLRKSKKIIRQKNGNFILTLDGLTSLGTAKHSKSTDVSRALDIAKRRV